SKCKDKLSGKSADLNGFRLDYIFVSSPLRSAIADAAILQEPRKARASDHACVIASIDIDPSGQLEPLRDEGFAKVEAAHPAGIDEPYEATGSGQPRSEE